jgi:hypothetical protein
MFMKESAFGGQDDAGTAWRLYMVGDGQPDVLAHDRFRRGLNRAQIGYLLSLVSGTGTELASYDEVTNKLKARQQIEMGTQMVPLDQIVGSVGRYRDFTRTFLPKEGVSEERWIRVDAAMNSMVGVPPVELFKIGEVYFVRDGNHRVSVARLNGFDEIEARVTVIDTDVDLTVDDFNARNTWIIKAERKDFLDKTGIENLCPDVNIELTEPGRYPMLLRHIHTHWYLQNLEIEREGGENWLDWPDAVMSWCTNVYMPVVEAIRKYDVMKNFPSRTEADLYLWIAHHREELSDEYDLAPLSPDEAVSTFTEVYSDDLLQRTMKGLRLGIHRVLGQGNKPLGMSDEEFDDLRARHDAGEISLAQAEKVEELTGEKPDQDIEEQT